MNTIRTAAPRALLAATLLIAASTPAQAQERYSWNRGMTPGQTLEIKGVSGSIRAVAGGGSEARVTAVKQGRRNSPSEVIIEVVEHGGGVTICAVYPQGTARQPNECRPGSGGRMSVENNDVTVEWTITVPDGVNFVGVTVNGSVEGENLPANAEARTVNGSVTLSANGLTRANTVNGSIEVTTRRSTWNGDLVFETVNGSIIVNMPADLSANVTASTVTGEIQTDFPLTVSGRFGGRRISGTVGNGGRGLELKTVNGSIILRRR